MSSFLDSVNDGQIKHLSRRVPSALIGQAFVIALTVAAIHSHVSTYVLTGWGTALLAVLLYRFAVWRNFSLSNRSSPKHNNRFWTIRFMIGAAGSGLAWGLSPWLFQLDSLPHSLFLVSIIIGVAGVSVLTFGAVFQVFTAMVVPLLFFPMTWMFLQDGSLYFASGTSLLIALAYLAITGRLHSSSIAHEFEQNMLLQYSDQRFQDVSEVTKEYLWEIDLNLKYLFVSDKTIDVKGLSPAVLIGHQPMEYMVIEDIPKFVELAQQAIVEKKPFIYQHRNIGAYGEVLWEKGSGIPIMDMQGNVSGLRGAGMNISTEKNTEDIIWRQANFDELTGLPNRHRFNDMLEASIKRAKQKQTQFALLFVDLDNFADINDSLGHRLGDLLLQEVAQRISSCVQQHDTVAYFGGDEFTVILDHLPNDNCIGHIAQSIISKLAEPYFLDKEIAHTTASIGITLYPGDANTADQLLMNADQSLNLAKCSGRNQFQYFTPALQQKALERRNLIQELRDAIATNQLILHFQPIVEISTNQIRKAEALIRWNHPKLGLISPATWIPLAEETGLILPIGDWLYREAARKAAQWRLIDPDFQLSINISPIQFNSITSEQGCWITQHIEDANLQGAAVILEITENVVLGTSPSVVSQLQQIKDAGIHIALDDFGTGYSSLSYLYKFNFDILKIDQSFIRNMDTAPNGIILVNAIINMARSLGIKVVAEGIETEIQQQTLSILGCDFGQGYLWSKPIPADEFETLLLNATSASTAPIHTHNL